MCLVFMSFRAPSSALKQKNYHNSPNMQPIITFISGAIKVHETSHFDYRVKIIQRVLSFYRHASFFTFIIYKKNSATYAFHMCVGYDKTKQTPSNKI